MNPVPLMPLVELVRGMQTSDEVSTAPRCVGIRLHCCARLEQRSPSCWGRDCLLPTSCPSHLAWPIAFPAMRPFSSSWQNPGPGSTVHHALPAPTHPPARPLNCNADV